MNTNTISLNKSNMIQVSSMEDAWAQDKINTVLNSLESQMTNYKMEETDQEFADFYYEGPINRKYCCVLPKPQTEVPLTGLDEKGVQYNVGKIDLNGNVVFNQVDSIRSVCADNILEWYDVDISVNMTYEFPEDAVFAIGGDGPVLKCNCLLYPCVMDCVSPRELNEAIYNYNYRYYYMGYNWSYNDGSQISDIVGWYCPTQNVCCFVTVEAFNTSLLTCTCQECHLHKCDSYTDAAGVTWTIHNCICEYCVYETWQAIPECDPITYEPYYLCMPVYGRCYIRPIFWCLPHSTSDCFARSWGWAARIRCINTDSRHGSVGGEYPWVEGRIIVDCKNDCWNPNNTYFSASAFDGFTQSVVNGFRGAGLDQAYDSYGCNKYEPSVVRNFAKECAPDKWNAGIQAIPYNKETYNKLKQIWNQNSNYHRTYKGGYIETVNHMTILDTYFACCQPICTYACLHDGECFCWGWNVPEGYLPLYMCNGVCCGIFCEYVTPGWCGTNFAYSFPVYDKTTGRFKYNHPYLLNCRCWRSGLCPSSDGIYCTPYDCGKTGTGVCNHEVFIAECPVCCICGSCYSHCGVNMGSDLYKVGGYDCYADNVSCCWFNTINNNSYLPYSYCRLTKMYCVQQHCVGTGTTSIGKMVRIKVRYRKARG